MLLFDSIIVPWLGKTSKMIDVYHTRRLKEKGFDLTKEQWVLLKIISYHTGVSQNEIACKSNRDKTSMTRLFNTLERKHLIARLPSKEDKRINQLCLTIQGEKMLADTEQIWKEMVSELQKGLSKNEIDGLINTLKKVQDNIEKSDSCLCN